MKFHLEIFDHKPKWNMAHLENCRQKT